MIAGRVIQFGGPRVGDAWCRRHKLSYGLDDLGFESWYGQGIFPSSKPSRQVLGTYPVSCLVARGAYSPLESSWVESNRIESECRFIGGAHRPIWVQSNPQESNRFLVLFKQCTGREYLTCLFCTQIYGEGGCVGREETSGARYKREELEFGICSHISTPGFVICLFMVAMRGIVHCLVVPD